MKTKRSVVLAFLALTIGWNVSVSSIDRLQVKSFFQTNDFQLGLDPVRSDRIVQSEFVDTNSRSNKSSNRKFNLNPQEDSCDSKSLIWEDEFNESDLDSRYWVKHSIKKHWSDAFFSDQRSNIFIDNGNLVLTARKEKYKGALYTGGRIISLGRYEVRYGRIEVRIKMPNSVSLLPAFYLLGENHPLVSWPAAGEIDIVEYIKSRGDRIQGSVHWQDSEGRHRHDSRYIAVKDADENYHTYAIEWSRDKIDWYVDDELYFTKELSLLGDAFHKPFYMVFTLPVIDKKEYGFVKDSFLPSSMYIDYVRVFSCGNINSKLKDKEANGRIKMIVEGRKVEIDLSAVSDPDGAIKSIAWEWGDDSGRHIYPGRLQSHKYKSPGKYTVTIMTVDVNGKVSTLTKEVDIVEY